MAEIKLWFRYQWTRLRVRRMIRSPQLREIALTAWKQENGYFQ